MTNDEATVDIVYQVLSLEASLGGRVVLGPLGLDVRRGAFIGVVGPNGSGKTTLLRALAGTISPSAGQVRLMGRSVAQYHPAELARVLGVVPQTFTLDFNFTVEEMAGMGRYAHSVRGAHAEEDLPGAQDHPGANITPRSRAAHSEAVAAALEATGMSPLADRLVTQLSGGERQRALIAQTLAQETPVLLLDEPLNNLDLNHQLEIMQLLRALNTEGRTIMVVLHDLNMAAQYCDELLLLDQGRPAARGTPGDVLDPRLILEVFKVRVSVHRQGRRPYVTPVWSMPPSSAARGRARVHVIGGGGAASALVEELVVRGFAPSIGIVSVFDTDYATSQRYELQVVSAPPFEPFPEQAMQEFDELAEESDIIVVAPVFFGRGNLAPLQTALHAAKAGKLVIVISQPPLADRDLTSGEATALVAQLLAAGAVEVTEPAEAADRVSL